MPPLPPVPQVLRVVLQGTSGAAVAFPWANVLHFLYSGSAPSASVLNTMAGNVNFTWQNHMAAECPNTTSLTKVVITDLTSNTSAEGESLSVVPGTRGDDEIPANAAALISYPVSVRYRGGHPRTYLMVGGNADFLDAAHWSTAFTAEFTSHWQGFLSAIIGYSNGGMTVAELVAVSYVDKQLNPTPPYRRTNPVVYPLVAANCVGQQQMASQRRRIGRRRR